MLVSFLTHKMQVKSHFSRTTVNLRGWCNNLIDSLWHDSIVVYSNLHDNNGSTILDSKHSFFNKYLALIYPLLHTVAEV